MTRAAATSVVDRRLVDMDYIGPRDIAIGQEWMPVVAETRRRLAWTIAAVEVDHVVVERDGATQRVAFGQLLSIWGLLR